MLGSLLNDVDGPEGLMTREVADGLWVGHVALWVAENFEDGPGMCGRIQVSKEKPEINPRATRRTTPRTEAGTLREPRRSAGR